MGGSERCLERFLINICIGGYLVNCSSISPYLLSITATASLALSSTFSHLSCHYSCPSLPPHLSHFLLHLFFYSFSFSTSHLSFFSFITPSSFIPFLLSLPHFSSFFLLSLTFSTPYRDDLRNGTCFSCN